MAAPVLPPLQTSLFGRATAVTVDQGFAEVERTRLAEGAWLDVQRGWVIGHDALFEKVLQAADWAVWRRPMYDRMVDQPRLSVTWRSAGLPAGLEELEELSGALSERYGCALESISANLYRDGQDSVAWHGDTHLRDQASATVAVVSLGSARTFKLRPRGGGESLSWQFGHGDLAVMGGTCQRTWQHAVPKVAAAGPRICVMFRTAAAA